MKKFDQHPCEPLDGMSLAEYIESAVDDSTALLVQRIVDKIVSNAIVGTRIDSEADNRYCSLQRYIIARVNAKIDAFFEQL